MNPMTVSERRVFTSGYPPTSESAGITRDDAEPEIRVQDVPNKVWEESPSRPGGSSPTSRTRAREASCLARRLQRRSR